MDANEKLLGELAKRSAGNDALRAENRYLKEHGAPSPAERERQRAAREKAVADEQARRGVPLIGALGGAVRNTRPDAVVPNTAKLGRRRGPTVEERLGWGETNGGIPIAGSRFQRSGATIRATTTPEGAEAGTRRLGQFSDARKRKAELTPAEMVDMARDGKLGIDRLRGMADHPDAKVRHTARDLLAELEGEWSELRVLAIQRNDRRLYGKHADDDPVELAIAPTADPDDEGALSIERVEEHFATADTDGRNPADASGRPDGRPRGSSRPQAELATLQSYADRVGVTVAELIAPSRKPERRDRLAVAVRELRDHGATLASIGTLIDRGPETVRRLEHRGRELAESAAA